MSSTPEISRNVKFSPYGKPISKSLLTPCRQIGLSRKRKTPSSLSKTPLNCSVSSVNVSPLVTPLVNVTPIFKTETEVIESSVNKVCKTSKNDTKESKDKTAKKCLDHNFRSSLVEQEIKFERLANVEFVQENKKSKKEMKKDKNKIAKKCLENKMKSESLANVEFVKKCNKSRKEIREGNDNMTKKSHDQNFKITLTDKESKINSKSAADTELLKEICSVNSENQIKTDSKKKAIVSSQKLSEDDTEKYTKCATNHEENPHDTVEQHSSDEESEEFIRVKKRTVAISSDDEDYENVAKISTLLLHEEKFSGNIIEGNETKMSDLLIDQNLSGSNIDKKTIHFSDDEDFMKNIDRKKSTLTRKESSDKKLTRKEIKQDNNIKSTQTKGQSQKTIQLTKSLSVGILDEEEDAFTSTPEREKVEKKSLIEKIKILESEVKERRKKLEDLKQAQIYKSKHNIEELKNLTEIWRKGSVNGLNSLLIHLQTHGPISMSALLNNLNISSQIAKESLKLDFKEVTDSNDQKSDSEDFQPSPF